MKYLIEGEKSILHTYISLIFLYSRLDVYNSLTFFPIICFSAIVFCLILKLTFLHAELLQVYSVNGLLCPAG